MTKKIIEEVVEEAVEETPIAPVVSNAPESDAKKAYRKLIEDYKVQNPVKYEMKKEAFEKKLSTL